MSDVTSSDDTRLSRQAEQISRKWGTRLEEFHLPCPLCQGHMLFQGVTSERLYEFAEDEPGVVQPLNVLPMSFICDRCGYTAEFDSDLFNPSFLAELQGADAEQVAELAAGDYRVLVPLSGEEQSTTLIDLASAIAEANYGEIIVLNPVTGSRIQERLEHYHPPVGKGVVIRNLHQQMSDVGEEIVTVANRQECSLVMVGWRSWSKNEFQVMHDILNPILDEATCDVAIVQDRGLRSVRRILLLTAGGSNASAAAPLALDLARGFDAELHLLSVVTSADAEEKGRENIRAMLEDLQLRADDRIYEQVVISKDITQAMLLEADTYDLVLIGAAPRLWGGKIQPGSITSKIARNCCSTTIVVRGRQPLVLSWVQSLRARLTDFLDNRKG